MSLKRFFDKYGAAGVVEKTVTMNVGLFRTKFTGSVPLPKIFAPEWSVVLRKDKVNISGLKVEVSVYRLAITVKNISADDACALLGTIDPLTAEAGATMKCSVDSVSHSMKEGEDFRLNIVSKLEATKAFKWL